MNFGQYFDKIETIKENLSDKFSPITEKWFGIIKLYGKKIIVLLSVLLFSSAYLALMLTHLMRGGAMALNPFVLIADIGKYGFPFGGMFIMLLFLVCGAGFMLWKSGMENLMKDSRNFTYSKSGVYGTAGLLQEKDLEGYAKINTPEKAEGTILGQLDASGTRLVNTDMKSRMNRHIAVFGASGSGKSRCFARPFIIQAVKRRESVIVTDPKGELYESTAQYLKDNGYTVKILDLVHPAKSDGWDCLKELRGDEIRAQIFANVIIENTGSGKGDIWDTSAMALLKALLLRVERGKDYAEQNSRNIGEAYQLIQNPLGEKYLDVMFDAAAMTRDEQLCIGPYMTFKQASPNMRGNIITGLAARMQVFQNEVIREITSVDDIDLTLPATEPCAYYCIMSDQHTTLNFLSTLFFTYLFMDLVEYADTHGGKCPVPVNFVLDEFPNIGSIPDFEKKIATVRSRMINISIIFQGITQLQERYPLGKWQGILGNCDTHLFLGCNEPDTAEFISNRTGETTVKVRTDQHEKVESFFTVGHKHSTGDGKRVIYNVDEIMRFPLNKELIIFRGLNVMKADKYDFSLHPEHEKFRDIRIMDRPDIDDEEGRKAYHIQDEEYKKAYERRVKHSSKSTDKTDNIDFELSNDSYREYEHTYVPDNDFVIETDDNLVMDDTSSDDTAYDDKSSDECPVFEEHSDAESAETAQGKSEPERTKPKYKETAQTNFKKPNEHTLIGKNQHESQLKKGKTMPTANNPTSKEIPKVHERPQTLEEEMDFVTTSPPKTRNVIGANGYPKSNRRRSLNA